MTETMGLHHCAARECPGFTQASPCVRCASTPHPAPDATVKCNKCDGAGWLWSHELGLPRSDDTRYACDVCEGKGKLPTAPDATSDLHITQDGKRIAPEDFYADPRDAEIERLNDVPHTHDWTSDRSSIVEFPSTLLPTYFVLGETVRIRLSDGKIELLNGATPDEAAKAFWEAVERLNPRKPPLSPEKP
jgi:hypothetical protein